MAVPEENLSSKVRQISLKKDNLEIKLNQMETLVADLSFKLEQESRADETFILNKEISYLKNELTWYKNTFDHLPKWFIKLGGIFRRWPFGNKKWF